MTSVKVKIGNIFQANPGPIRSLALNENSLKLALFRGGKEPAIEIWDVSHLPFLEKIITNVMKVDDQPSVEGMVWAKNRLYSCGLHGFVVEHDLSLRVIKSKTAATSGPVWCIGVSPDEKYLAAGTEDGFVNIFEIFDEGLSYLKVLDRQEGRVLCLHWSPCGKYIATGSVDSIRMWDVEKGHALQRLMTGRSKNTETIVWSIVMLDDFMIVSGDSRGVICLWDGRIGILKHKMFSHKADVLTLKLSPDKSVIYAAGVDPLVALIARVGKGDRWIKSHQRNMHTNDVMCLATYGNKLYSAGIDADLVVSSFPPKIITKYPALPKPSAVSLSRESNKVLIQSQNALDIWKLPEDEDQELLRLLSFTSRKHGVIHAACQSPSGNLVAYSTESKINVFRLSQVKDGKSPAVNLTMFKSDVFPEETVFPYLHFLDETRVLAVSASSDLLFFIEIDSQGERVTLKQEISLPRDDDDGITLTTVSANGQYLALADPHGSVLIVTLNSRDCKVEKTSTMPNYRHQATALAFHPTEPYLLVTYLDHSVKVWNIHSERIVYNDRVTVQSLQPILGAKWSPSGRSVALHEIDKLYLLELSELIDSSIPKKRTRRRSGSPGRNPVDLNEKLQFDVKTCNKYKFIPFIEYGCLENELFILEVKPKSLLENLPPAFAKKRFGM